MLEEKAIKAEKELCEALASAFEAEQEFRDWKEWVDALSHSTIHVAKKLGEMGLRMSEAHKGEAQSLRNIKIKVAKVKRDLKAMRELREQADT